MREELIRLKNVSIVGVLTRGRVELLKPNYCVIFLNAGAIHKIGPNRIYVKAARYLAQKGITCFRFDFSEEERKDISDNIEHSEHRVSEIKQVMDAVKKSTGINHFFLIALGSGAETAFQASLTDHRIVGVSLINGVYQREQLLSRVYDEAARSYMLRYYKKYSRELKRWRKILAYRLKIGGDIISKFLTRLIKHQQTKATRQTQNNNTSGSLPEPSTYSIEEWENLFRRKVRVHVLFSEGSSAVDIFDITIARLLRNYMNNDLLRLELVKDTDTFFTPIWSQDLIVNVLTERVLQSI